MDAKIYFYVCFAHSFQDCPGGEKGIVKINVRFLSAFLNVGICSQMIYGINFIFCEQIVHLFLIRQFYFVKFEFSGFFQLLVIQQMLNIVRAKDQLVCAYNRMPFLQQTVDQMASYKTGTACDEYLHDIASLILFL